MTEKPPRDSSLEDYVVHLAKNQNQATVDQLAELIRQKYPLPQEEIVRLLAKLESKGKIRLGEKDARVPMTTVRYVFSRGASWYWVTILLSLATAVAAFVIPEDAYPIVYVRYVLGSVFVLLLPGYCLIRAVFPSKVEIDIVERAAFSLGLSIALVPVVVLILSFSPLGIGLAPIILSLLPLTIAFATVAVVREHRIRAKEKQSPSQT